MILMIDNYDSFTYNLYQLCASFSKTIQIVRNDKISLTEIEGLNPEAIILSPGPKSPAEAGICLDIVRTFADRIPILGVCLGMQTIGVAFGAAMKRAADPIHGKPSQIKHTEEFLYKGIPNPMIVGRYHSLMLDKNSLPPVLIEESTSEDGTIMGVRHCKFPCFGVQFHPESILTQGGDKLIGNFFKMV